MMHQDLEHERDVALRAVREAALLCQNVQGQITPAVLEKKDRSPVTVADFGSQALICRSLGAEFPNDPVIAEEDSTTLRLPENGRLLDQVVWKVQQFQPQVDREWICRWIDHGRTREYRERFWTLDPIDGTKGFLRGEQYAVSLALMVGGRIEVAALACPNLALSPERPNSRGTIFVALRGQGAFVMGMDGDAAASPIRVSPQTNLSQARFCESVESGHSSHSDAADVAKLLGIMAEPVRMDSQAKYGVVARGEAEIYLRLPTRADYREKIWDHAGGVLIVAEAGGTVTDVSGRPLEFTHGPELSANRGVIVTNGPLHDRVLAALKAVGVK